MCNERKPFEDTPTTYINSLSEFIEHISNITTQDLSTSTLESGTFYRGQANSSWTLEPSLYRENLLPVESLMLKKMQHFYPDEFIENRLEFLAKMQHFGMPTRLLDTTTNPLVALYFACKSERQRSADGIVYVFPNIPIVWSNDYIVELIMDFVYNHSINQTHLNRLLWNCEDKQKLLPTEFSLADIERIERLLTHSAYAVMPTKANQRIRAQDGAFYIFGMKIKSKVFEKAHPNNPTYIFEPLSVSSPKDINSKAEVIIVPSVCKEKILNDLSKIGISEEKLFPDLPHQISHVVDSVRHNIVFDFLK